MRWESLLQNCLLRHKAMGRVQMSQILVIKKILISFMLSVNQLLGILNNLNMEEAEGPTKMIPTIRKILISFMLSVNLLQEYHRLNNNTEVMAVVRDKISMLMTQTTKKTQINFMQLVNQPLNYKANKITTKITMADKTT